MRPLTERVTSIDVARKCGVSQSTVSLVFSGKATGRISARTEAAVRSAAEELGYRPNAAARALKTGAARAIVLVVPDITNPFFGGLLRGAQTAARAAGYAVALIDTDNDREWGSASAEALRAGPADGLLLFEVDPPPFAEGGEPIVVIESESRGHPSARLDVEGGADAALRAPARARPPADRPPGRRSSTCHVRGARRGGRRLVEGPVAAGDHRPRDRSVARGGARAAARAPRRHRRCSATTT